MVDLSMAIAVSHNQMVDELVLKQSWWRLGIFRDETIDAWSHHSELLEPWSWVSLFFPSRWMVISPWIVIYCICYVWICMIYIYVYSYMYYVYINIYKLMYQNIISIPIVGHRNQSHALAAGPRNRCQRVADDRNVLWIMPLSGYHLVNWLTISPTILGSRKP